MRICRLTSLSSLTFNSSQVLIVPADARYEALTERLIAKFREKLQQHKLEPAWYPGMEQRYNAWTQAIKGVRITADVMTA